MMTLTFVFICALALHAAGFYYLIEEDNAFMCLALNFSAACAMLFAAYLT